MLRNSIKIMKIALVKKIIRDLLEKSVVGNIFSTFFGRKMGNI